MAEVNVRNILVGHGNLYYAENYDYEADAPVTPTPTSDEAVNALDFEDGVEAAFAAEDNDWHFLGATQEGVELAYAPEYGEVEVDQLGDAAVMFFERSTVTLNTQLAEATLENLLIAWGFEEEYLEQVGAGDTQRFSIGVKGADPVERSVAVVGKGAATADGGRRERLYLGRRVVSVEGSSLALRRGENTAYPVSLRLLADPAFPKSEYGAIIDVVRGEDPVDYTPPAG